MDYTTLAQELFQLGFAPTREDDEEVYFTKARRSNEEIAYFSADHAQNNIQRDCVVYVFDHGHHTTSDPSVRSPLQIHCDRYDISFRYAKRSLPGELIISRDGEESTEPLPEAKTAAEQRQKLFYQILRDPE